MKSRRFAAAMVFLTVWIWTTPGPSSAGVGQSPLPTVLDSFVTGEAHGDASDRTALMAGEPVIKLLDADPVTEVAVFGAVWVNAPAKRYVEEVNNIEQFERGGGFHITKRIGEPATINDFAALTVPKQDLDDLKACKEGDCTLKLDPDGLRMVREEVDWGQPNATAQAAAVFRRLAVQYVNGYRTGGNAKLAVYRDKDRPTFVAGEFRSMVDRLPRLATQFPDLKRYLLEYPHATLPHSTDFVYWQEVQFGLKPTIRINHLVIQEAGDQTVVASKMLYASHYFWTALELRVLMPDAARGPGFWFVTVNRSRSDGLSGFTGRVIRRRVRGEVEQGMRTALIATKARLESTEQ